MPTCEECGNSVEQPYQKFNIATGDKAIICSEECSEAYRQRVYHALYNAGASTTVEARNENEACEIFARVVGEETTVMVNGIELTLWIDELPSVEREIPE